jgi:hypothetical protein
MDFGWSSSTDLDGENLEYTLTIVNVFPKLQFTNIPDTVFTLDWNDWLNKNVTYRWTIEVTDGLSRVASPDTFSFRLADPSAIAGFADGLPVDFALGQNYPNPFNPSTTIEFTLPKSEYVELKVYNILGKEVSILVSEQLNQGTHTYVFDGRNQASGIYYYQLVAADHREVKKMVLLQ